MENHPRGGPEVRRLSLTNKSGNKTTIKSTKPKKGKNKVPPRSTNEAAAIAASLDQTRQEVAGAFDALAAKREDEVCKYCVVCCKVVQSALKDHDEDLSRQLDICLAAPCGIGRAFMDQLRCVNNGASSSSLCLDGPIREWEEHLRKTQPPTTIDDPKPSTKSFKKKTLVVSYALPVVVTSNKEYYLSAVRQLDKYRDRTCYRVGDGVGCTVNQAVGITSIGVAAGGGVTALLHQMQSLHLGDIPWFRGGSIDLVNAKIELPTAGSVPIKIPGLGSSKLLNWTIGILAGGYVGYRCAKWVGTPRVSEEEGRSCALVAYDRSCDDFVSSFRRIVEVQVDTYDEADPLTPINTVIEELPEDVALTLRNLWARHTDSCQVASRVETGRHLLEKRGYSGPLVKASEAAYRLAYNHRPYLPGYNEAKGEGC